MAKREPGALVVGLVYVVLSVLALGWLRMDAGAGRTVLLFLLFVVWSSDIGAYVGGRLVGGPKLAPAISPGKTWSGAAGWFDCGNHRGNSRGGLVAWSVNTGDFSGCSIGYRGATWRFT